MPPGRPRFRRFSPPSVRVFPFLRRLSFHGERRDMRTILNFRYRERQGNPQAWIPLSFCQLVIASLAPHAWSFQGPVQQPFFLPVSFCERRSPAPHLSASVSHSRDVSDCLHPGFILFSPSIITDRNGKSIDISPEDFPAALWTIHKEIVR